jgi:hypothetical protein
MQNHISSEAIQAMEKQQRVHFINSLLGFKSVAMGGHGGYFRPVRSNQFGYF